MLFFSVLFVVRGALVLVKARKMDQLSVLVGVCAICLILLGLRALSYALFSF